MNENNDQRDEAEDYADTCAIGFLAITVICAVVSVVPTVLRMIAEHAAK